jgi:hypothetical protein
MSWLKGEKTGISYTSGFSMVSRSLQTSHMGQMWGFDRRRRGFKFNQKLEQYFITPASRPYFQIIVRNFHDLA